MPQQTPEAIRIQLLFARANKELSSSRKLALLRLSWKLISPAIESGEIKDTEELFYLFTANAFAHLDDYNKVLQAKEGAEIIRKAYEEK